MLPVTKRCVITVYRKKMCSKCFCSRRFLRRPNVSEACEQFTQPAKRLRSDEEPEYEALCQLAVARCQQSGGQPLAEAEATAEAARSFLKAERAFTDVGCHTLEEQLVAAVHCYAHAVRIFDECGHRSRAGALCVELADALCDAGRVGQAIAFYERAADLRAGTVLEALHAKERAAACHIDTGDYHSGLIALTEVASVVESNGGRPLASVFADIMARAEIQRVLLLLLIEPTPQNISPSLTSVLDKYSWSSTVDESVAEETSQFLTEETFILLQSIVMAVEVKDHEALLQLEEELAPQLETRPKTLLRRIVSNLQDKGRPGQ